MEDGKRMNKTSNSFEFGVSNINVGDEVYNKIINKSFVENDDIELKDLVYIKFLHFDFNNSIKVGELIVNRNIKDKIISILKELFKNKYQISGFKLPDNYFKYNNEDGNLVDRKMVLDDNSSSFFYRKIYKTNRLSKHAFGLAIDINPKENPYLPYINEKYDYSQLTEEEIYYLRP